LLANCKRTLRRETYEQFGAPYPVRRNQLPATEALNRGTLYHAPVYPRDAARQAPEEAASSIIRVHNHPSGEQTLSKPDVEMTKQVAAATNAMGAAVHDHLVIGSNFTPASRRWA
jgi:DNA repair protein RadC